MQIKHIKYLLDVFEEAVEKRTAVYELADDENDENRAAAERGVDGLAGIRGHGELSWLAFSGSGKPIFSGTGSRNFATPRFRRDSPRGRPGTGRCAVAGAPNPPAAADRYGRDRPSTRRGCGAGSRASGPGVRAPPSAPAHPAPPDRHSARRSV